MQSMQERREIYKLGISTSSVVYPQSRQSIMKRFREDRMRKTILLSPGQTSTLRSHRCSFCSVRAKTQRYRRNSIQMNNVLPRHVRLMFPVTINQETRRNTYLLPFL